MPAPDRVRQDSQDVRLRQLELAVSDMRQRFDTLQTPLYKRVWFRVNGWPGQRDLNATSAAWRPWRRWVKP